MKRSHAILVGSRGDPHLDAVLARLAGEGVVVIDAATATEVVIEAEPERTVLHDVTGASVLIDQAHSASGWIRRLAPAGWDADVPLGSHPAAVLAARLGLLAALLRDPAVRWLSDVDALFAAENKLVAYRAAARLGHRVPRTRIGWNVAELAQHLGDRFIVKPLGPGSYSDDGEQRVVFTRSVVVADLVDTDLRAAPFIAQEELAADLHLRVVTVGASAWVTGLDAASVPCDWRRDAEAHDSFAVVKGHEAVANAAVALAAELRCGYSSQDWIVDGAGAAFIDFNPAGQWLFLPEPVASAVTEALAATLRIP